eukprot:GFUD01026175.1.p1 GENE.GFUD01026175.1~~GFUD01026175.1.p1  ORF type:complete len:185 (+),score=37.28 GFUD01026175.1:80-634(+)
MEFFQDFGKQDGFNLSEVSFSPEDHFKKADFMFDDIPTDNLDDLEDIQVEDLVIVNNRKSTLMYANNHLSWSDQLIRVDKYESQLLQANILFSTDDLISSSLESFLLLIKPLSLVQQNVCKDIRRKARNKIHALNCRRKKNDAISELQDKILFKEEQLRSNKEKNKYLEHTKNALINGFPYNVS